VVSGKGNTFVLATVVSLLLMSHSSLLNENTTDLYENPVSNSADTEDTELLSNGDYEEILVKFGDVSIGDLYGLFLTIHDTYGESYQFWFDTSGSDYYDVMGGQQIAVYDVNNISEVAYRLSDLVNSSGSFQSWSIGHEVFIISSVRGDIADPYTNSVDENIDIIILKQGTDIRVSAIHQDIAWLGPELSRGNTIFRGLDDGSVILAVNLVTYYDAIPTEILGCSMGDENDSRASIILKLNSDGDCDWLRRLGGNGPGGGIQDIHVVEDGIIVYINSKTLDNYGNVIEGIVPTTILGEVYEDIDLFAKIDENGIWIDAEACSSAPVRGGGYTHYQCNEYSISKDTIYIHSSWWNCETGITKINLQGSANSNSNICLNGYSQGYAPDLVMKVLVGQDDETYSLTKYHDSNGFVGHRVGGLFESRYSDDWGELGYNGAEGPECLAPIKYTLNENGNRNNRHWDKNNEWSRSFMFSNQSILIGFTAGDLDSGSSQGYGRCSMKLLIINTTSHEYHITDAESLPGYQSEFVSMIPRPGKNEVCFTNARFGAMEAREFFSNPTNSKYGFDFKMSCYNEELDLLWNSSNFFPSPGVGVMLYYDYSGSNVTIMRPSTDSVADPFNYNYVISRVVSPDKVDLDSDSILDLNDWCLGTEDGEIVDEQGCSWRQRDDDGDKWSNGAETDCGTEFDSLSSIPDDFDGDFECDLIDDDDDNDGAMDEVDLFPYDELDWSDFDGDGIGDNADNDDDNDGWSDVDEIGCLTDHLDSLKKPVDNDGDGDCDEVNVGGGLDSENVTSYCDFQGIGIYSDSQGCAVVFSTAKSEDKTSSNIVSVSTVSRGSNGVSEMVLSNDGNVLAILDPFRNLRIEILNQPSSSYSMVISENDHLLLHPITGRVSITNDNSCLDILTDLPCGEGWLEENLFSSTSPHWTGSVYFSHEYTACKPGWTGLAHCNPGWYEVGEWNEFSSPSMQGLVSNIGESQYCPGCSSPDGRYLADIANIATDWEFFGVLDSRMDVIISSTETWTSSSGEYEKPGGVATIVGGHFIDDCNSIVCMISEMSSAEDGMMFGVGGFAWSGDSGYLYAATSDSIITIDPDREISFKENNPYECGTTGGLSQLVGVSTPDGSTVVIPCGDDLLILTIERGSSSGVGEIILLVLSMIIVVGSIYWWSRRWKKAGSMTYLIVLIMVAPVLSGCIWEGNGLDTDPRNLPGSIEISLQGGVVDGNPILYIDIEDKVPPETIDILVVTENAHSWVGVTNVKYTTQYNMGSICQIPCEDVSITAFYRGKSVNSERIYFG